MNLDTITLTTAHAASSYGRPVLVIDGEAYGPADMTPAGVIGAELVGQWAASFTSTRDPEARSAHLREALERIENLGAEHPETNWTETMFRLANLALAEDDRRAAPRRLPRMAELRALLRDLWAGALIGDDDRGFVNVPADVTRRVVAALREE